MSKGTDFDGSRFKECPFCGESIPSSLLQTHANSECRVLFPEVENRLSSSARLRSSGLKRAPESSPGSGKRLRRTPESRNGIASSAIEESLSPVIVSHPASILTSKSGMESVSRSSVTRTEDKPHRPLADRMRPRTIADVIGQDHLLGEGKVLRNLLDRGHVPSMILFGPPGVGKTALATVISRITNSQVERLSAVNSGVADLKRIVAIAAKLRSQGSPSLLLFVDEIHQYSKIQQNFFLDVVEKGTLTLIGATTEDPSFSLRSALLSRCRVFNMKKLTEDDIIKILLKAIRARNGLNLPTFVYEETTDSGYVKEGSDLVVLDSQEKETNISSKSVENDGVFRVESGVLRFLARTCDGDARRALTTMELAFSASSGTSNLTGKLVCDSLCKSHLLFDRKGDNHYDCISALIKSMRGSDPDAALYWCVRILSSGEDPLFVTRRLVRFASEDIGLADPNALPQAIACHEAVKSIGQPECNLSVAQGVVLMALARKSHVLYRAYDGLANLLKERPLDDVPLHLRNATTTLHDDLGYGKGYVYQSQPVEGQTYLPDGLVGSHFIDL